jgi:hypothetical protein
MQYTHTHYQSYNQLAGDIRFVSRVIDLIISLSALTDP